MMLGYMCMVETYMKTRDKFVEMTQKMSSIWKIDEKSSILQRNKIIINDIVIVFTE